LAFIATYKLNNFKKRHNDLVEQTNRRRAERAGLLVNVYHHMTSCNDEMEEEIVPDLLADLMHYCRINDIDIEAAIKKAFRHFVAEIAESD
jgi:NTP pyrophosphatase (non-canonical NTP hydrolase)